MRRTRIQQAWGQLASHAGTATSLTPSVRMIGVEIEIVAPNHSNIHQMVSNWGGKRVHDGSLPEYGTEINTAPSSGHLFAKQIKQICEAAANDGAYIVPQCGLHEHIDCRALDARAILRLARLYAAVEPTLFLMVPPVRRDNRYCQPTAPLIERMVQRVTNGDDADNTLRAFDEGWYAGQGERFRPDQQREWRAFLASRKASRYDDQRYHALNLHSWSFRGTVECRLMNGTLNPTTIIHWGQFLATLVDRADAMSWGDCTAFVMAATANPLAALEGVLPADLMDWGRERIRRCQDEVCRDCGFIKGAENERQRCRTCAPTAYRGPSALSEVGGELVSPVLGELRASGTVAMRPGGVPSFAGPVLGNSPARGWEVLDVQSVEVPTSRRRRA